MRCFLYRKIRSYLLQVLSNYNFCSLCVMHIQLNKSQRVLVMVFIFGRCSIKWMRYSRSSWAGLVTRVRAGVRPRSHFLAVFRPDRREAQLGTLISPGLTGQSNDQERCDQAVVHSKWYVMDRNSIIALLLYRSRKCRHNRLHWVYPVIKKKEDRKEFCAFYTLFHELRADAKKFFNRFRMSVPSFDELHCRLKEPSSS
jgi:hypothetical protein